MKVVQKSGSDGNKMFDVIFFLHFRNLENDFYFNVGLYCSLLLFINTSKQNHKMNSILPFGNHFSHIVFRAEMDLKSMF